MRQHHFESDLAALEEAVGTTGEPRKAGARVADSQSDSSDDEHSDGDCSDEEFLIACGLMPPRGEAPLLASGFAAGGWVSSLGGLPPSLRAGRASCNSAKELRMSSLKVATVGCRRSSNTKEGLELTVVEDISNSGIETGIADEAVAPPLTELEPLVAVEDDPSSVEISTADEVMRTSSSEKPLICAKTRVADSAARRQELLTARARSLRAEQVQVKNVKTAHPLDVHPEPLHKLLPKPAPKTQPSLLLRLKPTNLQEAMEAFFASDCSEAPRFTYGYPDECVVQSFAENSVICHELLPEAKRILDKVVNMEGGPSAFMQRLYGQEKCGAAELSDTVAAYLREHHIEDKVDIRIVDGMLSAANVYKEGPDEKYIVNIGSEGIARNMVQGICDHEVGTHLLRMMNDELQVWHRKRDRYKLLNPWITEEGLATINTYQKMPCKLLYPQALRYFAVCRGAELGFVELFHEILPHFSSPKGCWQVCCRIKRGMLDTSMPGAFYMDQAYFKGAVEILRHLDELDMGRLYCGQIALQDLDKVRFISRKEVVRYPHFLNSAEKVQEYMIHCRELIKENEVARALQPLCRPSYIRTAALFRDRSKVVFKSDDESERHSPERRRPSCDRRSSSLSPNTDRWSFYALPNDPQMRELPRLPCAAERVGLAPELDIALEDSGNQPSCTSCLLAGEVRLDTRARCRARTCEPFKERLSQRCSSRPRITETPRSPATARRSASRPRVKSDVRPALPTAGKTPGCAPDLADRTDTVVPSTAVEREAKDRPCRNVAGRPSHTLATASSLNRAASQRRRTESRGAGLRDRRWQPEASPSWSPRKIDGESDGMEGKRLSRSWRLCLRAGPDRRFL